MVMFLTPPITLEDALKHIRYCAYVYYCIALFVFTQALASYIKTGNPLFFANAILPLLIGIWLHLSKSKAAAASGIMFLLFLLLQLLVFSYKDFSFSDAWASFIALFAVLYLMFHSYFAVGVYQKCKARNAGSKP